MDKDVITLVAAYLQGNQVPLSEIPKVVETMKGVFSHRPAPAVPVDESIQDDYLVCLEDGTHVTLLKRYLKKNFDLSPEAYRERWGLPEDYPMVPPKYSERRSGIAKEHRLGQVD